MRFLLFLIAMLLPLAAQETMIREVYDTPTDTNVEVLALFTQPSSSGYFPVRVKISNNLKDERSIRLDFSANSMYDANVKCESTFSFSAGAGKSVTRDILVPIGPSGPSSYNYTQVSVRLSGSLGTANNSVNANLSSTQPSVLLSESLFTPNASALDAALRTAAKGGYSGSGNFAGGFDPKQLPDEWLAFSGYDSVILTDADWTNIPPGGRNAILSWLRMGGQLVIYTPDGATAAALGLPAETGSGSVEIHTVPGDLKLNATETVDLVLTNATRPQRISTSDDFQSSWPLQAHFGAKTFRYALFVIVLVIFAILVGPVNLFVFAKSGQRHKLFITTPIISLAASLVLIILIIAQDGFGGSGMRRVLMEVRPDAGLNAAYIHQEQFSRTGVLTGSGFTVSTPATLTPVPIANNRWARYTNSTGKKGNFNLQPVDGKLIATGDWFQSRSEHGHILSAVVSTRGRIERTDEPGVFLSTFAFPIETLFFLDEKGEWSRAEHIQAGKRFTPVAVDASMATAEILREANGFAKRNKNFLLSTYKRPGHYVAITGSAPGIDTLPGIRWQETRTVITGPVAAP